MKTKILVALGVALSSALVIYVIQIIIIGMMCLLEWVLKGNAEISIASGLEVLGSPVVLRGVIVLTSFMFISGIIMALLSESGETQE